MLLGAAMRLVHLGTQIVNGDEVHALRVAKEHGLAYVLTHFNRSDNCIPLTAWCRVLLETTGLDEWGLRALPAIVGLLLPLFMWRRTRNLLGEGDRLLLTLLAAGSPLLVSWSREGRPYGIVAALGFLAVVAQFRLVESPSTRRLVLAACLYASMLWFSLTAAPFVGAVLLAAWLRERQEREGPRFALRTGLVAGLFTLLMVGPALPSLFDVLAEKAEGQRVTAATLVSSARLVFGLPREHLASPTHVFLVVPVALVILGLVRVRRLHRPWLLPALVVLVLPGTAYAFSELELVSQPRVFVRYQAAAVPLLLLALVLGLAELRHRVGAWVGPVGWILAVAAFALGPLRGGLPPENPYGPLMSRLYLLPEEAIDLGRAPTFYRELAGRSPTVVEWPSRQTVMHLFRAYQELHSGRFIRCHHQEGHPRGLVLETLSFGVRGIEDRVPPGAYVVLHRRVEEEYHHVRESTGPVPGPWPPDRRWQEALELCRAQFGSTVYEDEWITAFRAPGG